MRQGTILQSTLQSKIIAIHCVITHCLKMTQHSSASFHPVQENRPSSPDLSLAFQVDSKRAMADDKQATTHSGSTRSSSSPENSTGHLPSSPARWEPG
jgi:hypothetical protein